MTEKYVDLAEEIWRADEGRTSLGSVNMVLDYLDAHPGHVPGRTIAESTERDLYHAAQHGPYQFRDALIDHRIFVVPDPEPTNAEHDRAWWIENANVNDAEDCEACVDDLCPVHHGIALGIEFVTKKIAALGDDPELFNSIPNPPKAPGGDE